jgi:Family of unknown function (DUF6529)
VSRYRTAESAGETTGVTTQGPTDPRGRRRWIPPAATLIFGAVVGIAVYAIGRNVTPDYTAGLFGQHFADAVRLKAQLGTAMLALALIQLTLALWMYGRLPGASKAPHRVTTVHRVVGVVLFLLSIPVAIHCINAYGIELTPARAAVHSIAGCFFYGAFAAKVLLVHSRRLPGWALPVTGGTLAIVIGALWYYHGYQLPAI